MRKTILVNGREMEWEENLTIDEILKRNKFSFKMLVVKVNGKLIKKEEYKSFVVPPNADVKVIHLISGG
ncbi:MAG: thiamine biosynthesis protein ThiS [Candidatus Cloacimonadota bacterium]|nr:MAG: thiamine biosynthesis protein ThiS [Candidatus Cloacimonadota bacterium]